ncbi:MAG: hypothetical protein PHV76_05735, partial [Bacteroidales bacterium]|nr:hypothetical protein [Bacteroidales bacterium]
MKKHFYIINPLNFIYVLMLLCIFPFCCYSQNQTDTIPNNILSSSIDSLVSIGDSTLLKNDSIKTKKRKKTFDERVNYSA